MVPVPPAPKPVEVLLLDHVYKVPGMLPVGVTAVVVLPTHHAWDAMALTVGIGVTVITKLSGVPVHETPLFV